MRVFFSRMHMSFSVITHKPTQRDPVLTAMIAVTVSRKKKKMHLSSVKISCLHNSIGDLFCCFQSSRNILIHYTFSSSGLSVVPAVFQHVVITRDSGQNDVA